MYVEVDVILHAIGKPYGSEKFWSLKKSLILLWVIKGQFLLRFWNVLVLVLVLTFASILID